MTSAFHLLFVKLFLPKARQEIVVILQFVSPMFPRTKLSNAYIENDFVVESTSPHFLLMQFYFLLLFFRKKDAKIHVE